MKPMVFFIRKKLRKKNFGKKNQIGRLKKKLIFQFRQFSFSLKFFFQGLVLGLVGLIDAKGIDVAQPIWS